MPALTERDLKDRLHSLMARGQLEPALAVVRQLITMNGREALYRLKHAEVSARLNRLDAAVASYRVAAHLLAAAGRTAQAKAALHAAMKLAPRDVNVRRAVAGLVERVPLAAAEDAITEPHFAMR